MCHIFAGQAPETYESQTRSIRIGGHSTSIRLEAAFWSILDEVAAHQGMSLGKFITTLNDEVLNLHGEVRNFASLLRCSCLIYLAEVRGTAPAVISPREAARRLCDSQMVHLPAAE
ncbi:ribbon-helix-helix domain-containing protein [Ancylobacter sp. 6x-1]|uniref:Ribbon-helix-helix domain-containing protein n=1 Tax=Ancylobacter crimeensis TaxID=2579147 RepID=A0ABT0DEN8_9HYPH|nr:ribbon-helix-helix domain-containing protein [Ancylobacter crimeensis]MCK0198436.1 ribbon-helix-helix domain-containing protein [Ancylobacter crimeensis]